VLLWRVCAGRSSSALGRRCCSSLIASSPGVHTTAAGEHIALDGYLLFSLSRPAPFVPLLRSSCSISKRRSARLANQPGGAQAINIAALHCVDPIASIMRSTHVVLDCLPLLFSAGFAPSAPAGCALCTASALKPLSPLSLMFPSSPASRLICACFPTFFRTPTINR